MQPPAPTGRVPVAGTGYHITIQGRGAETTLAVRHDDGRLAGEFGLREARLVALALTDASVAHDGYPPFGLRGVRP